MDPSLAPLGAPVEPGPARRPQRRVLSGRWIRIEPLQAALHAPALWDGTHGSPEKEALWRYMFDGPFADRPAFEAELARKQASADPLFYALIDPLSSAAVGYAAFLRITPADRVIEVGSIVYGAQLQRSTAATEAMYLMARYVFEELGYRRYEWKCDALNAPSRRAALRLGFSFEGVFRQHMIIKGRNRDTAWYSMLDSEWPARRAAFERWLDPANFDPQGRQRSPLSRAAG